MELIIDNGRVVLTDKVIDSGYVRVRDGRIAEIGEGAAPDVSGAQRVDAAGGWISHGLCDIHLHGNGGYWGFFGAQDLLKMSKTLVRGGVTAFVPGTVSLPHKQVLNSIREMKAAMEQQSPGTNFDETPATGKMDGGARILGIQIEGPYINPEKGGAHIPTVLRIPAENEIDEIIEVGAGRVRIITLAPELELGMEAVEKMSAAGVVVAIGHSMATASETHEAIRRGATHFTHLFNAVRGFHHREPGCAFAALADPGATVEIILDGKHVHYDAALVAIKAKGHENVALVSDSIMPAGLGDGDYNVWGMDIIVKDGKATTPDGTMAGSVITLNQAVRNAVVELGLPANEAFAMATTVPFKVLGLEKTAGRLEPGRAADLAIFDEHFNCTASFVAGARVY